jgi:hypothetical protein
MPIRSGSGRSLQVDAFAAGKEAAEIALKGLNGQAPNLVIVFSSIVHDQQKMLEGVRSVTGGAPLVGCSTAGEISTQGPTKKSVVVMALAGVTFHLGVAHDIKASPLEAGKNLAKDLQGKCPGGKFAMMMPDGLAGNGADIVRGMQEILGEKFLIAGGAAGDDFLFKQTYQYLNDQVLSGSVVGVMVEGDCAFGFGVRHGWKPVGNPMKVTKSQGAIVYEIDGKPAIHVYEEYFGRSMDDMRSEPLARVAITYPLGLRIQGSDEYLIRDPITVGEKGELTCAAEVPEGSEVNLMMGSKEHAIEAAKQAAEQCVREVKEMGAAGVSTAVIFNCIARDKVLGQQAQQEIDALRTVLGEGVQLIGFYTYGEQAPIGGKTIAEVKSCRSEFCNETVVIVGFGA